MQSWGPLHDQNQPSLPGRGDGFHGIGRSTSRRRAASQTAFERRPNAGMLGSGAEAQLDGCSSILRCGG
jgi:hypothetical protein